MQNFISLASKLREEIEVTDGRPDNMTLPYGIKI